MNKEEHILVMYNMCSSSFFKGFLNLGLDKAWSFHVMRSDWIENTTIDNSASYIQSWLRALKDDKTLIVSASQKVQKASDHILGIEFK